jgi:EAL domain-containing protein (putative c-di-GMP-specific phosphodiesterase class I)
MGVDYIQGYVIAKPMPPDVFVTWLAERRASSAGGATLKVATA